MGRPVADIPDSYCREPSRARRTVLFPLSTCPCEVSASITCIVLPVEIIECFHPEARREGHSGSGRACSGRSTAGRSSRGCSGQEFILAYNLSVWSRALLALWHYPVIDIRLIGHCLMRHKAYVGAVESYNRIHTE